MSQKKCPKCGEDNPAEAVMCWACYTPLAAGPAAGAPARGPIPKPGGPGGPAAGALPDGEDGEKKKLALEPKMIGVIAFLVVGGGAAFLMNSGMLGGGKEDEEAPPPVSGGTDPQPQPQPQPGNPAPPPANLPPPSNTTPGNGAMPAPVALPYTPVVPPNPGMATATIGIVPSAGGNISSAQAASLARFAKVQYQKSGRWKNIQIFVFSNPTSARAFGDYQSRRKGAPLTHADYQSLANSNVWDATPAVCEVRGKAESVAYPSKAPTSWWSRRS